MTIFSLFSFPLPWRTEPGEEKMKFGYLNGYRGVLALLVVLAHAGGGDYAVLKFCIATSRAIPVCGFFTLSSFLLTYRLLKELLESQSTYQDVGIIVKFTIRRFFRIYIVVMIFLIIFKTSYPIMFLVYQTDELYEDSWWNVLTLRWPAKYMYQLWTIPVEIKYYFCIPVICLIWVKGFGPDRLIYPFAIGLVAALANQYWNFLSLRGRDLEWDNHEASGRLMNRFAIFFYGSLASLGLHLLDTSPRLVFIIKNSQLIQDCLSGMSLGIIWYVVRYQTNLYEDMAHSMVIHESIPSLLWSILILIMNLGDPNCLTSWLSTNAFLTSAGKYSLGIYLWHVPVIYGYYSILGHHENFSTETIIAKCLSSYLTGYLFYCLVEEPLIRLASSLCSRVDDYIKKIENEFEFTHFKEIKYP